MPVYIVCTRPGCETIVKRRPSMIYQNVYCSTTCYYAHGIHKASKMAGEIARKRRGPDYKVDPRTGCWVWQKSIGRKGYGRKYTSNGRADKKSLSAHRWYYEQVHGPIPDDLQIDHLCLNKACVNPDHLEVVTNAENRRRASPVTHEGVRHVRAMGWGCVEAARYLGVSTAAASKIVRGETWAGV